MSKGNDRAAFPYMHIEHDQSDPGRQAELESMHERLYETLGGHRVLEIGCSGGQWTAHIAQAADSVLATDTDPADLERAKAAARSLDNVSFATADPFDLQLEPDFTACFAAFWWSRVKRQDQAEFLTRLRKQLGKNVLLVLVDENYIEEVTTIARTDLEGNTFLLKTLANHQRVEVQKNFPTDSALRKKIGVAANEVRIFRTEHYWMLTCRLK